MELFEAIKIRHAVRNYTDKMIEGETLEQLRKTIDECNQESGMNIQLFLNEPTAFSRGMAKYGKFKNVKNYIALVGKKEKGSEEKAGYFGEKVVLRAQQLGLNTCWVGLTYSKNKVLIKPSEKCFIVIAVGYGETNGVPHKSKTVEELCETKDIIPDWFRQGMESSQLAPTSMNQQKFRFKLNGNLIKVTAGSGFYSKTDLGIAKYHFEIGAGKGEWKWV
jgi:hypothetical protein